MATAAKPTKRKARKKKYISKLLLSNIRQPTNMPVAEWQTILRRQIAERTDFIIKNSGEGFVFSDYQVYNAGTKNTYKVALRSADNSLNYCSCYDFKTNQLGTCKHIEAVLIKVRKKPALRKVLQQPSTSTYSSMYMEYRGERKIMFRIGTENTPEYKALLLPYVDKTGCLNINGYEKIDLLLKEAFQINPSFRCYEDALTHIIRLREKTQRHEFLAPYLKKKKLPVIKSLKVKPFPYQAEGILFCASAGRSILADDMGLGKTIQAIGVAQFLHEYRQVQKVLIICPTSLKYQWQTEIEKFSNAAARVIEGNFLNRQVLYKQEDSLYKIASYNMAVNDLELINAYQPDLIILDEAQRIKNWQTKVSQSVKKLQSKYAMVLTGTPIENKLQELYSLVQFIDPLQLGSLYNFISAYEQTDETGKVIGYKDLYDVREKLKHILLRRTKKQVLSQLPTRTDKNLFVDITNEQKQIHNDYADIVTKLVSRWKKTGFLKEEDRQRLMISLNMMRMVCNSTYIIDQQTNHQTKLDELFSILAEIIATGDEKIVIFSQWERFTRLIAVELDKLKIGYANLNGTVPSHKRKDLFDKFNNDENCRIFLSTDAGGVGLNLQAGSWLLNMDLPWNPAVLEQRIARIYRQGQKRNVNIINFVAQHTIEHSMLGKLKFKAALAEGILDNGESNIFIGDSKFNVFMQGIEGLLTDETVATAHIDTSQEEIITIVEKPSAKSETAVLYDDDDIKQITLAKDSVQQELFNTQSAHTGQQLIQTAASFFTQLGYVLNDAKATENLIQSLTKKDEVSGQTYLQIPVENEGAVKNAVGLLAALFKGFSGK
ncbi:MAG TPA: DEAD/DEAH box helicase [Chitinophagaceae bacterium]|nr:DEAD/DEAH box helicase [Chitinophagaceae bacterium]